MPVVPGACADPHHGRCGACFGPRDLLLLSGMFSPASLLPCASRDVPCSSIVADGCVVGAVLVLLPSQVLQGHV